MLFATNVYDELIHCSLLYAETLLLIRQRSTVYYCVSREKKLPFFVCHNFIKRTQSNFWPPGTVVPGGRMFYC